MWLTDIAGDDGQRMLNAINKYADYVNGVAYQGYDNDEIKDEMETAFDGADYQDAQKTSLVDKIINTYDGGDHLVPTDDEETLQYLGIRKQCLEWAMTLAYSAGGNYKGYYVTSSVAAKNVRPGMGLYNGNSHAMIIIDVYNDANGDPTRLMVAEANFLPDDWHNPDGQVPWNRTVDTTRVITNFGGYTIVDYGER